MVDVHDKNLTRKPDIVLPKLKTVFFIISSKMQHYE